MPIDFDFRAAIADVVKQATEQGLAMGGFCIDPNTNTAMTFSSHGSDCLPKIFRSMAETLENNEAQVKSSELFDA